MPNYRVSGGKRYLVLFGNCPARFAKAKVAEFKREGYKAVKALKRANGRYDIVGK